MSAWGQLWVRHSRIEADPEQTQNADPGFDWGLLSVRLGFVGTVYEERKKKGVIILGPCLFKHLKILFTKIL